MDRNLQSTAWVKSAMNLQYPESNIYNNTNGVITYKHQATRAAVSGGGTVGLVSGTRYMITVFAKSNDPAWKLQLACDASDCAAISVSGDGVWQTVSWTFTAEANASQLEFASTTDLGEAGYNQRIANLNATIRRLSRNIRLRRRNRRRLAQLRRQVAAQTRQRDARRRTRLAGHVYSLYAPLVQELNETDATPTGVAVVSASDGGIVPTLGSGLGYHLERFSEIYAAKSTTVVNIMMEAQNGNYYYGTGFFISADGYVATVAHVVSHGNSPPEPRARRVYVHITPENIVREATIVGLHRVLDVAVLHVSGFTDRPFLEFANSRTTPISSFAAVIGNALGTLSHSVTLGVVRENKGVDFSWEPESVHLDSETVGGNSGSPVLNSDGDVIGILSWGLIADFAMNGAIASYVVEQVVAAIRSRGGDYVIPYLGVETEPMDMWHVVQYGLDEVKGIYVLSVESGSSAAAAGIQSGDVILAVDGTFVGKINNQTPFRTIIDLSPPGSVKTFTIRRGANTISRTATLGTLPGRFNYLFADVQNIKKLHSKEMKLYV